MILYQDKEIVVCLKPYGVSSQEASGENMVDMLREECGCEIYPVHRLDVQTTGLMVYAKTQKYINSQEKLNDLLNSDIKKFKFLIKVNNILPDFLSELKDHGPGTVACYYANREHINEQIDKILP